MYNIHKTILHRHITIANNFCADRHIELHIYRVANFYLEKHFHLLTLSYPTYLSIND